MANRPLDLPLRGTKLRTGWRSVPALVVASIVAVMLPLLAGMVVFETWPARPRDWIGWTLVLFPGAPLLLLGEWLSERADGAAGKPGTPRQFARLFARLLVVAGAMCAAWFIQAHLPGDPVGAFLRWVEPHYH